MSGPSTFAQSTPGRSRTACSRTNRRSGTPIATASSTHPNSRRFKGPTPPSQTRISDILTRTRTAKSRARAGDLGDALYIVAHGNVEILASGLRPAEGSGGSGEAITQLGARHAFGEMALLSGGPRTATIRAVEDTELMKIGKDDFEHWRVGRARPRRSRHDSRRPRRRWLARGAADPRRRSVCALSGFGRVVRLRRRHADWI
jgi:hypothetical protein